MHTWETLSAIVDEFIKKANKKTREKMIAVTLVPFTDTPEKAENILRVLTSG